MLNYEKEKARRKSHDQVWNRRLERLPAYAWGAVGAALASLGWGAWLLLL